MAKYNVPPEVRAERSARLKAQWANNRERMMEISLRGGVNCAAKNPNRWPPRGSKERALFDKIARCIGAAATHAHFRGA